jgi:hypothetical protein
MMHPASSEGIRRPSRDEHAHPDPSDPILLQENQLLKNVIQAVSADNLHLECPEKTPVFFLGPIIAAGRVQSIKPSVPKFLECSDVRMSRKN